MRKGQAAMEFLMTYGWAILVVLAAIGALAYFGVLSPDKFLPDKCTASAGFTCTEYKVTGTQVQVKLQNNAGVDLTSVNVTLTNQNPSCSAVKHDFSNVQNGNSFNGSNTIVWNCASTMSGAKFKADLNITYVKSGETTQHTGSASLQARIE